MGGHPRTLEYLDALLRVGETEFDDVAERMKDRLAQRGVEDPQAWMASPGRDLDANLAAAVTIAVDDILLDDLLKQISRIPFARELVVGASVYRVPVDDTALVWQIADEFDSSPNPGRPARNQRVREILNDTATRVGRTELFLDEVSLSEEELKAYQADLEAERGPPVEAPATFGAALEAIRDIAENDFDPDAARQHLLDVHVRTAGASDFLIGSLRPAR